MPASLFDDLEPAATQAQQLQDAFERGQAALIGGDKADAMRWLERAHRLAPRDGTVTLVLATATIGQDNSKAATLFEAVLATADVRDAWFGLATARFLMGDLLAARTAIAEVLSRYIVRPDTSGLAGQIARATGAAGWCGLTSAGTLLIHRVGPDGGNLPIEIRVDGRPLQEADALQLPASWPHARSATVTHGGNGSHRRHLIGSPVSLRAIARIEGHVEAFADGLRGWAWYPGDPDADPQLTVGAGRLRREIVASDVAANIPGLAPLARPRAFAVSREELAAGTAQIRVRGRDGLDLPGSPIARPASAGISHRRQPLSRGGPSRERPPVESATTSGKTTTRRIDLAQWRNDKTQTVVLVTHDDGGGVERRVQASVALHEAQGRRAVVLRPAKSPGGHAWVVATNGSLPVLQFELPRERAAVLRLLQGLQPIAVEIHHLLNHDPSVFEIIRALDLPYDAHVHDYAWFCPRIALVGHGDRYCGEPAPTVCQTCVNDLGGYLNDDISVAALLDRSMTILSAAKRVIAPSNDAATRLARHFRGIAPLVVPHEDDDAVPEPPAISCDTGTVRICVAGAIGLHKGFNVLLACARDARQRSLDLTFIVAGTTIDDERLMDTGRVFVTGPYQPNEAVDLIRAQAAALGLLPSIWPETWCLGLTELWRAGLNVAAFDIGAPAERIRRTGRGLLLPLHLTPAAINDTLLKAARGRSSQRPVHEPSAYKVSH
jgi:glycosyltransferase involved in cell wall biosynthesis